jgi:hypothetical protein
MKEFEKTVLMFKENGLNDYWDLDLDQQRKVCALLALDFGGSVNDVLDDIDAEKILKHMVTGNEKAAGEYCFSMIQKFLEHKNNLLSISLIEEAYDNVSEQ